MSIVKEKASILTQTEIARDIFDMTISFPEGAKMAVPGQFMSLYCNEGARLLPRPISICGIDPEAGTIRMIYRIAGEGTREFSKMKPGDTLEVMGPLGNGFHKKEKRAVIVGGGIGIPPMLELAKQLPGEKTIVLGYRDDKNLFLKEEFEKLGTVRIATDDGSLGVRGTVIDAIREYAVKGEIIYACGPMPMLKALAEYAGEHDMEAQISLEERMACGIGACLGCICKSVTIDPHTNVNNKRICKEGPVFDAKEVVFG